MKKELNDDILESVTGGAIVINSAHTTCGYNCNNQYSINNYSAFKTYYKENNSKMCEKDILKNCVKEGYISPL